MAEWLSTAWSSGSERRFYDGHDRKVDGKLPPSLVVASLNKMPHILPHGNYLCFEEFNKK